ncbi:hypothetical protein QVD17_35065 [Tagetes erecta]|uniref:Transmembrane protein n=1 Tax=Tagetes erecta TaxID=13708 RepID=A0AAD8K076_TARER|nr:hypothetical protein QVD17_35065 [Tagetes erecta]
MTKKNPISLNLIQPAPHFIYNTPTTTPVWNCGHHHHSRLNLRPPPPLSSESAAATTTTVWICGRHHHTRLDLRPPPPLPSESAAATTTTVWFCVSHHIAVSLQPPIPLLVNHLSVSLTSNQPPPPLRQLKEIGFFVSYGFGVYVMVLVFTVLGVCVSYCLGDMVFVSYGFG